MSIYECIYVYFYMPVCLSVCHYVPTPHNLYRCLHNFSINYKILLYVPLVDFSLERESELFIHFTRQFVRSSNCSSPIIHVGSVLLGISNIDRCLEFEHIYSMQGNHWRLADILFSTWIIYYVSFYVINSHWIVRKFLNKYLAMFHILKKKLEKCLWNRLSMCICIPHNNFWKLETFFINMAYISSHRRPCQQCDS
jgi:hypothetical protein